MSNYDEETGLYYIKDEATGEILYASDDENSPAFKIYRDDPDYNPNPLQARPTSLEEFMIQDEENEEVD